MPGINITGATSKATQAGSLVDAARLQANVDQSKVPPGAPGSDGGAAAQAMTASFQVFNQMLDALNKIAGSTATTAKNTEARTATAAAGGGGANQPPKQPPAAVSAGPAPKPMPVPPGGTPASFAAAVAKLEREMAADEARQQNRQAKLVNASADEARKMDEKKAREQRAIEFADANKMNRDFDRAKAGGGGSGFGGGGIGRGGAQYGRSFLSATGMGAAGGMGLGVVESGLAGNPIAMMAEGALAVAAAPQIMSSVVKAFNSATKGYQDYTQSTYAMGRQRGVFGGDIYREFFKGLNDERGRPLTEQWLTDINMGPEDAIKSLEKVGARGYDSAFGAHMLTKNIGEAQLGAGFSGIEGGASDFAKFLLDTGLGKPNTGDNVLTGVSAGLKQMDEMIYRGMTHAIGGPDIMKNMEQGIVSLARYTGTPNQADTSTFLEKFLYNGGTYGRSGAMGLEAIQGTQQAALNLGATPLGQMLQGAELKIASSREGLIELMGGGTGKEQRAAGEASLAEFESTDGGKRIVREYLDSRAKGMMGPAERQALATITANTKGVANLYAAKKAGLGGAFATPLGATVFGANVTGQTLLEYTTPPAAKESGAPVPMQNLSTGASGYDNTLDARYKVALSNMGIQSEYQDAILASAKETSVNPLYLGAIMKNESEDKRAEGSFNQGHPMWGSSGEIGPMQLMAGTYASTVQEHKKELREMGFDPEHLDKFSTPVNVAVGSLYYKDMLTKFGDPKLAAGHYNGGPNSTLQNPITADYMTKFDTTLSASNLPKDLFKQKNLNESSSLAGGATTWAEFNSVIVTAASGLNNLGVAANKLTDIFNQFTGGNKGGNFDWMEPVHKYGYTLPYFRSPNTPPAAAQQGGGSSH